jgi:N-acetylmuramoyl-L-alanine amidase
LPPSIGQRKLEPVRIFRLGDDGPEVGDIQERLCALGASIDDAERAGVFGPTTESAVRSFQGERLLRIDGLVGDDTWGQLVEAGYRLGDRTLYLHSPMYRGDDVSALQRKLNALGFDAGREDGLFGRNTDRAIREFQRNVGEDPDGIVGLHTISTLERMRPDEASLSRAMVRETEELLQMRASAHGQIIAIDAGSAHASDPIDVATQAIAQALGDHLAAMDCKPVTLGGEPGVQPLASDRAREANALGAAMCISLHLASGSPDASGPTCSYFGSATSHSPAGMLLAQLILDELEAELDVPGRLQRLTGAMLRETRMPAVQVGPASITNEADAAQLADPDHRERVARAIAAGVRRFFGA